MLKQSELAEERRGGGLMAWWDGRGAAAVLARSDGAIVIERAEGRRTLSQLVREGQDDNASKIMCATLDELHAPRGKPLPELVPLDHWFASLAPAAATFGGNLALSAAAARDLLAHPEQVSVLHGDIHHGNVLDFGPRGWLAIDPKALIGERAFDYANIFFNPDHATATTPGRFKSQISVVAAAARLGPTRLARWVLAWAGLSAAWHLSDGTAAETALTVAEIAASHLSG